MTDVRAAGCELHPTGGTRRCTGLGLPARRWRDGGNPLMFTTDDALNEYLKRITELAYHGDEDTLAELARATLPRLVCAVKGLLEDHRPDRYGRCPTCREAGHRRLKYPNQACPAYQLAYRCVVDNSPIALGQAQHAAD